MLKYVPCNNIVTNMTVARQRFGKHICEATQSTVGPPVLGSRSLGTFCTSGQNTNNSRVIHEVFEVVFSRRFAPSYKREGIRESSFATQELKGVVREHEL
jgi:hypothetical protein